MGRSDVLGAPVLLTDMAQSDLKLFGNLLQQNSCQFAYPIVYVLNNHNF